MMLIEITLFLTVLWLVTIHRYLRPVREAGRARQGK